MMEKHENNEEGEIMMEEQEDDEDNVSEESEQLRELESDLAEDDFSSSTSKRKG